jgi:hypothetical protein
VTIYLTGGPEDAMSQAYRARGKVSPEGTLKLENLPFQPGDEVEVIVIAAEPQAQPKGSAPLRGTLITYDDPTAPVAESDWEAIQ